MSKAESYRKFVCGSKTYEDSRSDIRAWASTFPLFSSIYHIWRIHPYVNMYGKKQAIKSLYKGTNCLVKLNTKGF